MAEQNKNTRRPTAQKRLIQSQKRAMVNKAFKSRVRTGVRRFEECLKSGDQEAMTTALNQTYSLFDKGVKRGIYKLNKAKRVKSRLAARVAALA